MINEENLKNYIGKKLCLKSKWDSKKNEVLLLSLDTNYKKDLVLQVCNDGKLSILLHKELDVLEEIISNG